MMELNKIEIIKTVLTLPDKIRSKEATLLQLQRTKLELETQLKNIETDVMSEIMNQTENNKPLFSNEIKRKIELKARLTKYPVYIDTNNRLQALITNLQDLEIEYVYLKNLFRSYEIVARMG